MISASWNYRLIGGRIIKRYSLFFTPRTQINAEFSKRSGAFTENSLALENVPTKPEFAPELKIFKEIVRPNDVCNPFLLPDFNDVVITALAKDCPISGKPGYSVTSKSQITDTKLVFADTVIEWMDDIIKDIPLLLPIPDSSLEMRYSETDRDQSLNKLYTDNVWGEETVKVERHNGFIEELSQIDRFFEKAALQGISHERAAAYLLSRARDDKEFKTLMENIQSDDSLLVFSTYFASKAVENVFNNYSTERGHIFRDFFIKRLKYFASKSQDTAELVNDAAVLELEPLVLDKLVYIISSASTSAEHLIISKTALFSLTHKYRYAPLLLLFKLFLSSYCKFTTIPKDQILEELTALKACFVSVPIPDDFFTFYLKNAIDSTYDLSHFLKVVSRNSPDTVTNNARKIFARLKKIQAEEEISDLIARIQLAQVGKLLLDAGLDLKTCEDLIISIK